MSARAAASGAVIAVLGAGCSFIFDWDEDIRVSDGAPLAIDGAPVPDAACVGADCQPADAGVMNLSGCADGAREAFVDIAARPDIAGCAGGFALPGVLAEAAPVCVRSAGDDGENPTGTGCIASDLCAEGWHVCLTPAEVAAATGEAGCAGAVPEGAPAAFYAVRQSGPGGGVCGAGANDVFGCGSLGLSPAASCAPLDRFSDELCAALGAPWNCGGNGGAEAQNVTKPDPAAGGVLCCRDS